MAARDRLAAERKAAGEGDAAASVKRLKRPTRAASLVNRLSLEHPTEMRRLVEAGERLRELQSGLGRSASGEELREAAREERDALAGLMEIARDELGGAGPSRATVDRVAETLQAAVSDEETARIVSSGRVDRERRAASVSGGAQLAAPPVPAKAPKGGDTRELKEARASLKALQRRAKAAGAKRKREREALERARADLERAQAAVASRDDEVAGLDEEIARTERLIDRLSR